MQRVMAVNWKIFYQRRGLWFWYVIMLCQLPTFYMMWRMNKPVIIFPAFSMLLGILAGTLEKEILSRPLTFCLPEISRIPRRVIFWLASIVNCLLGLLVFKVLIVTMQDRSLFELAMITAAMAVWGMTITLLCVQFAFDSSPSRNWLKGVGFTTLFFVFFFGEARWKWMWFLLTRYPMAVIVAGLVFCVWMWFYLGRRTHGRRLCVEESAGMFDGWDLDKMQRMRLAKASEKWSNRGIRPTMMERLIVPWMKRATALGRACWGALYSVLDSIFIKSYQGLVVMLLLMVAYGYMFGGIQAHDGPMSKHNMVDIVYILPVLGALMWILPVHPTLYVPTSRRGKFYGSLFAAVGITGVAIVWMAVLVGMVNAAEPYLAQVPVSFWPGLKVGFRAPLFSHIYLMPMFMPLGFLAGVLFKRQRAVMMFVGPILFGLSMAMTTVFSLEAFYAMWWLKAIIAAVFWLLFIGALHRRCLRGNLV